MGKLGQFDLATRLLYQTVADTAHWPDALEAMSRVVGGQKAFLAISDGQRHAATNIAINHDEDALEKYNSHLHRDDPWWEPLAAAGAGTACTGQSLKANAEFDKTEYYEDFMRRGDILDTVCGIITDSGPVKSCIGIQRVHQAEFYDEADRARLQWLLPHLENAVTLQTRFASLCLAEEILNIGCIGTQTILLDRDLRIVELPGVLQSDLEQSSAFSIWGGRLALKQQDLHQRVSKAVTGAIDDQCGSKISCSSDEHSAPIVLRIAPIPGSIDIRLLHFDHALALCSFEFPLRAQSNGPRALREIFGLTMRELELLNSISRSYNLKASADELEIKYETARWHLKQILNKTHTRNQAELLVLSARAERYE